MMDWYYDSNNFFFFNDTATTEIYTLSLHDALPICALARGLGLLDAADVQRGEADLQGDQGVSIRMPAPHDPQHVRSEEHTSELQSRQYLVCRLLLEKKKKLILYSYLSHYNTSSGPT